MQSTIRVKSDVKIYYLSLDIRKESMNIGTCHYLNIRSLQKCLNTEQSHHVKIL